MTADRDLVGIARDLQQLAREQRWEITVETSPKAGREGVCYFKTGWRDDRLVEPPPAVLLAPVPTELQPTRWERLAAFLRHRRRHG